MHIGDEVHYHITQSGADGSLPRRTFLEEVLRVCALREERYGRRVEIERRAAPALYGEVAVVLSGEPKGPSHSFVLAALPRAVTPSDVELFRNQILVPFRESHPAGFGQLVCAALPPSEDLTVEAGKSNIHLFSLAEYQGLIDFGPYLARLASKLSERSIYPQDLYIPQRVKIAPGMPGQDAPELTNALKELDDLLASPNGRLVLVLGNFGTGKTFLLREFARILIERKAPPYPVLVEMRALDKAQPLDSMLAAHLTTGGLDKFDKQAFRYMLREGLVTLLFDGFDELVHRVQYERAAEHFDTVLEAAEGKAKVVVTSRTQHFYSDKQIAQVLAKRAETIPGYRVAALCPFDRSQIQQFFGRLLRDEDEAHKRIDLLNEIKDLLGLSENPRMLSFIADLPPERLRAANERTGEITSAMLYQELLDWWLTKESQRASHRGAAESLTTGDRWSAVATLALRLWSSQAQAVRYSELPGDVARAIQGLSARQIDAQEAAQQLGSGTLLVRDGDGNFSFIHRSVLEWLVARSVAEDIQHDRGAEIFKAQEMSDLMADFFWQLAGKERAEAWARGELEKEAGIAKSNALRVLLRLRVVGIGGVNLAGQDLRGRDFSDQDLRGADLRGAILTDATLFRADLSGALLTEAILVRANLREAKLGHADLRGANLSFARLLGADLRHARLSNAIFRYVALTGAKLSNDWWREIAPQDKFGISPVNITNLEPVLPAGGSQCNDTTFSVDGAWIASAHGDGTVRIWNAATGELIRILRGHLGAVTAVAFSADGALLASGTRNGTIILWVVAAGEQHWMKDTQDEPIAGIAFSPDGVLVVTSSLSGVARGFAVDTGELKQFCRARLARSTKEPLGSLVASNACSADVTRVASGLMDGTIQVFNGASGKFERILEGHLGSVVELAMTDNGEFLASGSTDNTVRLWNANSGEFIHSLRAHTDTVLGLAFSERTGELASGSSDRTVCIWSLQSGTTKRVLRGHSDAIQSVAFARDKSLLAAGSVNGSVTVWDSDLGDQHRVLTTNSVASMEIAFSPDGTLLASVSSDKLVRLWETATGEIRSALAINDAQVMCIALHPDNGLLAAGASDGNIHIWNTRSGTKERTLSLSQTAIRTVRFSGPGDTLAAVSADGVVFRWDTSTRHVNNQWRLNEKSGIAIAAFSPDDRLIAIAVNNSIIKLWDTINGREMMILPGWTSYFGVKSLAFSDDGRWLACGRADGEVAVVDVKSRETERSFHNRSASARSVAFSPDNLTLATAYGDGTVALWNASSGEKQREIILHGNDLRSLTFSPSGTLLAVASNAQITLCEVASGERVANLIPHPEGWAVLLPTGRYKLSHDGLRAFWYAAGLCRFEPGELDALVPSLLKIPHGVPLR